MYRSYRSFGLETKCGPVPPKPSTPSPKIKAAPWEKGWGKELREGKEDGNPTAAPQDEEEEGCG